MTVCSPCTNRLPVISISPATTNLFAGVVISCRNIESVKILVEFAYGMYLFVRLPTLTSAVK